MRKRNILDILMIIVACSLILISSLQANAASNGTVTGKASTRTLALKAYKKKLSKSKVVVFPKGTWCSKSYDSKLVRYKSTKSSKVKFALAYINNDVIPELIIKDPQYGYALFTYRKGIVKRLMYGSHYDQPKAYYMSKGIFVENATSEGTPYTKIFYKMIDAKIKKVMNIFYIEKEPTYYEIGKKHVSEESFLKKLNNYIGDSKIQGIKLRKNTKTNRKKYLK